MLGATVNNIANTTLSTANIGNYAGGNYTSFESNGTMVANGDATTWDDIFITGDSLGTGASAPDVISTIGSLRAFAFDGGTTTEQLYTSVEIPHDYKEGTALKLHLHWMPAVAGAGTTGVVWQCEYAIKAVGAAFTTSATIVKRCVVPTTQWQHDLCAFADIAGTGLTIGSIMFVRIFRDPTYNVDGVTDDYPEDAALLSIGIHYQQDTLGSRDVTTK